MSLHIVFSICFSTLLLVGLSINTHASSIPDTNISVTQLHEYCPSLPNSCGKTAPCEGQIVSVAGRIDYSNVFSHATYPQLPYEKFFLTDNKNTVEVVVVTSDNESVFKKIFDSQNQNQNVIVKGTIVGINMPTMKSCRRGIRLELRRVDDVSFQ